MKKFNLKNIVFELENNLFQKLRDQEILESSLIDAWIDDRGRFAQYFIGQVTHAYNEADIDWYSLRNSVPADCDNVSLLNAITILLLNDEYINYSVPEDKGTVKIRYINNSNFKQVLQNFIVDKLGSEYDNLPIDLIINECIETASLSIAIYNSTMALDRKKDSRLEV